MAIKNKDYKGRKGENTYFFPGHKGTRPLPLSTRGLASCRRRAVDREPRQHVGRRALAGPDGVAPVLVVASQVGPTPTPTPTRRTGVQQCRRHQQRISGVPTGEDTDRVGRGRWAWRCRSRASTSDHRRRHVGVVGRVTWGPTPSKSKSKAGARRT